MSGYFTHLQGALATTRAEPSLQHTPAPLLAVAAVIAALTAAAVMFGGHHVGFLALNKSFSGVPAVLLQNLTYLGDSLIALLLLLPFVRRYPQLLWLAVLAAVLATLASNTLKPLFDAARPPAVLAADSFRLVGPAYKHHSFPSGHTITAFVTAGVFAYSLRRWWLWGALMLLASAIGLSRVAVGVHWPVDVGAGAAIGLSCVALAVPLARRWQWGVGFWPYHGFVLLLSGVAVSSYFTRIPYPSARPLLWLVATVGLACVIWNFVVVPLRQRA